MNVTMEFLIGANKNKLMELAKLQKQRFESRIRLSESLKNINKTECQKFLEIWINIIEKIKLDNFPKNLNQIEINELSDAIDSEEFEELYNEDEKTLETLDEIATGVFSKTPEQILAELSEEDHEAISRIREKILNSPNLLDLIIDNECECGRCYKFRIQIINAELVINKHLDDELEN